MNHDASIDAVAQAMTAAEPAADLRARVLGALPPTRRPLWPRIAIPAAAVASLALAWMVMGTTDTRNELTQPSVAQKDASLDPASHHGPVGPVVPVGLVVPVGPAASAVSADELAWRARAVPLMPAASPLELSSIQPIPLSITPITVERIMPEPIALAAIDGRNAGRH